MKIEIRILTDEDMNIVMNYLKRNPIETAFLYGNIKQFGISNNKDISRCGDYYGYFEGGKLLGILPFYNLGSCIPHFESERARIYFSKLIQGREFDVLLNMSKIIDPIYEEIKNSKKIIKISDDSYFVNNNFIPFKLNDIEIKTLDNVSLEKAINFHIEAREKGFGEFANKESSYKTLIERAKEEETLFLIKNEEILATACVQTYTDKINQIGGVYTTEKARGKGYCKAIVSNLCNRILKREKTPTLMVRKNNYPAVKAYHKLGFEYYDDYKIINLQGL